MEHWASHWAHGRWAQGKEVWQGVLKVATWWRRRGTLDTEHKRWARDIKEVGTGHERRARDVKGGHET
jgi:hypothetical protein